MINFKTMATTITNTLLVLTIFNLIATNSYGHSFASTLSNYRNRRDFKNSTIADGCSTIDGFTKELVQEIRSHKNNVKRIIDLVLRGQEKHSTHRELALFCDTFGPRLSGSKSLSDAVAYMKEKLKSSKLDNVHGERAMIPKWEIGKQWAKITEPVAHQMTILALGTSVGTPGNYPLEAEVQLVHDWEELDELGQDGKLKGKIAVFNYRWSSYGECVKYRELGALKSSKYGAVAALIRSVTPFSIYSPHAGHGSKSIPTAAITLEDADLIERWNKRGKKVVLKLFIDAQNYDDVESENLIGEIEGSEKPNEVVLISGHMDSWYNTAGAMDDGGGMMISYKAVDVLRKLNLRAKRTVRAVLWTSEEFGLIGAQQYFKDHRHELNNFKVVMESDLGTFKPLGLSITNANKLSQCIVNEVLKLTEEISTTRLDKNYEGSDIELFSDAGVPGLSLANENSKYFYFHHTSGDSITLEDPDDLDKSTILWAASSYVLADLSVTLSKN